MTSGDLLYIGLKSHVIALDKRTGAEMWRTQLKSGLSLGDRFVVLLAEPERIFAQTKGELFCLNAATGELLWSNPLTGLSYDLASLATLESSVSPTLVKKKKDAERDSRSDGGGQAGAGSA